MKSLKKLKTLAKWIKSKILDILVPEEERVHKLLTLSPASMLNILPKSPVHSGDLFVIFDYQNKNVRLIVKSIKYKNNPGLRRRVAGYMHEEILEMCSEMSLFKGSAPLLVPMPMSKKEKRQRGFNQCEELVKEIKKMGDKEIEISCNALRKTRETERQTKLSREKRLENVKYSMAADSSAVRGRILIVLDDVYTTGASMIEARRALLSAGACRAIGLFIAH